MVEGDRVCKGGERGRS
jgi:hypothetical protein